MRPKRERRLNRFRIPALIIFIVVAVNAAFFYNKGHPGVLRHAVLEITGGGGLGGSTDTNRVVASHDLAVHHSTDRRVLSDRATNAAVTTRPQSTRGSVLSRDADASSDAKGSQAENPNRPLVRPKFSLLKFFEGVDGAISMRADGPDDPADTRRLLQLAPLLSKTSNGPVVELHAAEKSRHKARHLRLANEQAEGTSTLRSLLNVLSATTERVERRFRFVLIVLAVRTRKHLDVFQVVKEWQASCDDIGRLAPGPHATRPYVVCLTVVTFPSDYANSTVDHYRSLFEDDDTILSMHSDVPLAHGILRLQQVGFEAGVRHFTRILGIKAEIDYTLLTSVQFVPAPSHGAPGGATERPLFVVDLVRQYEEASDVVDVLARRVAGGASRRGPILGCTTVLDQLVSTSGGFDYQGDRMVVDQGVEFLYGNGGGGSLLNSLYAVRRHGGFTTHDERVNGRFRDVANNMLHSQSAVNASLLPPGVDVVHAISPYCVLMSERVFRMLSGAARVNGAKANTAASSVTSISLSANVAIQSQVEDYEEAIGTGNHRSKSENRSVIDRFTPMDHEFEHLYLTADHEETKQYVFDVTVVRLLRLDKIRSSVRFSDVMSGSPQFKRLVSFFIRFLDEAIRFFDSVSKVSFAAHSKDRSIIMRRLPRFLRVIEEQHEEVIDAHVTNEDRIAAALVYASRGIESLGRWYRQHRARSSTASPEHVLPEEAMMWDLCLRARGHQFPTLISNLTVRFQQHEYLEGAVLSVAGETSARHSPIYAAYVAGAILPVSTRISGPFQKEWESALVEMGLHPSFHQKPRLQVVWYTHCCHCCGFSNELQSLVYPLQRYVNVHLTAGPQCFCTNASRTLYDTLERLHAHPQNVKRYAPDDVVVYISHTNPTLYHLHQDVTHARHDYLIGRSMYEFSRINAEHIELANRMADEIWVPAQFVYHSYLSSGALREKLVIIPEAIDTHMFNPMSAGRIALPPANMFHMCNRKVTAADAARTYNFLSDFKWEPRKGWDVLFEAYFRTFNASDSVVLFVMTHIWFPGGPETYGWANNITWIMGDLEQYMRTKTTLYANDSGITLQTLPTFCIISQSLSVVEMAALYNSADAFVYTTRGEGWGLPAMQAMSMGLPVVATNFGGVTEFLKPFNSFLVPLDGVVEIPFDSVYGWSFGTKWASPSVKEAGRLMRYLATHPDHGKRVGAVARKYVVENFSEEALGKILNERLQRIREKVLARRVENEMRKQLKP